MKEQLIRISDNNHWTIIFFAAYPDNLFCSGVSESPHYSCMKRVRSNSAGKGADSLHCLQNMDQTLNTKKYKI